MEFFIALATLLQPSKNVASRYGAGDSPLRYAHPLIIKFIKRYAKSGSLTLDVGCGAGFISRKLSGLGHKVIGVEIDGKAAREAKKYCIDVLVEDIEQVDLSSSPETCFDTIICADILEHLKRPDLILLRLRKVLSSSGILVVSLPNIAEFRVRMNLLIGKFDYQETGILDKTHLRFFTRKTAVKLITLCGFDIVDQEFVGLANYIPFRLFPSLFASEFIFACKKR